MINKFVQQVSTYFEYIMIEDYIMVTRDNWRYYERYI